MIARDIVFDVTEHALTEAQKHSVVFAGDITTNGYYLNEKVFVRLIELQIKSYQITLDGPPNVHNQTRILLNGRGTFDQIWANLENMHQSDADFVVLLRMNVHDGNYDAIRKWLPTLSRTFLREDKRFLLHFHAVFAKNLAKKARPSKRNRILNLYRIARTYQLSIDLEQLLMPFGAVCYATKANNFVVRSNGDINKCTVAFDVPQNKVGKLTPEGELNLNENYQLWVQDTLPHSSCQSCTVAYQCGGHASCPLKPIVQGVDELHCEISQDLDSLIPLLAI